MRLRLLRATALFTVFAAALFGPFIAAAHADPVPVDPFCVYADNPTAGGATVCTPWN